MSEKEITRGPGLPEAAFTEMMDAQQAQPIDLRHIGLTAWARQHREVAVLNGVASARPAARTLPRSQYPLLTKLRWQPSESGETGVWYAYDEARRTLYRIEKDMFGQFRVQYEQFGHVEAPVQRNEKP